MSNAIDELYKTSPELFPKVVAVAMDGNRRWAKAHGLKEIEGHRKAIEGSRQLIKRAAELGVKKIIFWIFSTENFRRDTAFLDGIYSLAREYLQSGKHFKEITEMGGALKFIGDLSGFPKDIADHVLGYVKKSNPQKKVIDVIMAFGYGGRDEIVRAVKKLVASKEEISEEALQKYLDLTDDVDLVIRTGDRVRTSGFLTWQAAYSELYFTEKLCPDFTAEDFDSALLEFTHRVRNFGR